jgi:RNA polymerase sigma-70 factor, ECF subfamily
MLHLRARARAQARRDVRLEVPGVAGLRGSARGKGMPDRHQGRETGWQARMHTSSEVGDDYLVVRARDGYLDAYEMLVQRHSAMAYRLALRLCGNHHDAQDVAQESLVAAWQNLARFRGSSSFSTWLYQIVTRRALNAVTRGRSAGSLDLLADMPDHKSGPAVQAERSLAGHAVTQALAALPFPQRTVVVLHHFEGLSYAEVAAVTRSTVPAVRSHLFRARRTLGTTLEEWR